MNVPPSWPPRPGSTLVVGFGAVDRGDDAVGPVVARLVSDELAAHGPTGVQVIVHDDPTALLDLIEGRDLVVVVDAVHSGSPPGTLTVREAGREGRALPTGADRGWAGTHGLGLSAMIELARSLDRLPDRVVVVGVEAAGFEHGRALSAPVVPAVAVAAGTILDILRA